MCVLCAIDDLARQAEANPFINNLLKFKIIPRKNTVILTTPLYLVRDVEKELEDVDFKKIFCYNGVPLRLAPMDNFNKVEHSCTPNCEVSISNNLMLDVRVVNNVKIDQFVSINFRTAHVLFQSFACLCDFDDTEHHVEGNCDYDDLSDVKVEHLQNLNIKHANDITIDIYNHLLSQAKLFNIRDKITDNIFKSFKELLFSVSLSTVRWFYLNSKFNFDFYDYLKITQFLARLRYLIFRLRRYEWAHSKPIPYKRRIIYGPPEYDSDEEESVALIE
ncbi:hypothetical protein B4U80_14218, partial [Leptotrombidium deliense]